MTAQCKPIQNISCVSQNLESMSFMKNIQTLLTVFYICNKSSTNSINQPSCFLSIVTMAKISWCMSVFSYFDNKLHKKKTSLILFTIST